jgi:hypothetical protein
MPLVVTCDCGKSLKVKDSLAGKRIRCPECQELLTVPAAEEEEPAADEEPAPKMAPARAPAKAATKAKRRPEPEDDDEEEEEERPRARAKKKKGKAQAEHSSPNLLLLLGIGGGALVLAGAVVVVLLIVNSQPGTKQSGLQAGTKDGGKGTKDDGKGTKDGGRLEKISNPEKEIIGKWRHDGMLGKAAGVVLDQTLEFHEDGTFIWTGPGWSNNGTWKQSSKKGNAIAVATTYIPSFKGQASKEESQTLYLTVDAHNVMLRKYDDKGDFSERWKRIN